MSKRRKRGQHQSPPPRRRFPSDEEVDAWLDKHVVSDADELSACEGVAIADQKAAAADDSQASVKRLMEPSFMRAHGFTHSGGGKHPASRKTARYLARMYLAAASVGIHQMCPHVNQIRPIVLMCDPPSVSCRECLLHVLPRIHARGYQYNHHCDHCGMRSATVALNVSNFANMLIFAHLCPTCTEGVKSTLVHT